MARIAVLVVDAGQREPAAEEVDDERAERRADQDAAAAEEAGAADHDRGDRLEVAVGDGVRAGCVGPADLDPCGEAVDQPGSGVDADEHPVDADAGQPGGLGSSPTA